MAEQSIPSPSLTAQLEAEKTAPQALNGWAALQRAVNQTLAANITSATAMQQAALRALNG